MAFFFIFPRLGGKEKQRMDKRNISEENLCEEDSLFPELKSQIRMMENHGNWQIACAKKERKGWESCLKI